MNKLTEEEEKQNEEKTENGLSEEVVNGLTMLHSTGLRFLTIIVQPTGELTLHTAEGSNRIEIVGLLEVARDAVRT